MQVQIRHQPSFAVARLALAPQEPVRVEAGAMVATSYGVHFAGPGRVLTQTRNPSALLAWLSARMPSR